MFQDQRRWTASLIIALVVLVAATVSMGNAGLFAARTARAATYEVEAGDSLHAIAAEFGVSTEALAAANGLSLNGFLRRGQVLTIPDADQSGADVAPTESTVAPDRTTVSPAATTYTVQAGDSLWSIAKAFGTTIEALAAANGLNPAAFLARDQVLVIPGGDELTVALPSATVEATAEPTVEVTVEPTVEVTVEPTVEATPEPTATPTEVPAEVTAEVTIEATEAMTVEATVEPTMEPTIEATEVMTAAVTIEATAVMTAEATAEPTMAPVEEATPEATAEATPASTEPTPTETAIAEESAPGDVVAELSASGEFSMLVAALQAADLVTTLEGDGPFTVFAPTDAAFDDLPMGAMNALLIDPTGDLAQILLYHVAPGLVATADITDGQELMTLQGSPLTLSVTDDKIKVNGASIVTADLPAANGVIHVIDAVLVPSAPTASATPAAAEEPSTMILPMIAADQEAVAAANAWPAPVDGPEVFSPVAGTAYHSPIAITGLAQPGAGDLAVSLTGTDGILLAERTVAVGEAAAFFQTYIRFEVTEPITAVLTIGNREVPVTLVPGQRFIDVNNPAVGAVACGQVTVDGYSNTFEANVVLTLTTHDGRSLAEMPTMGGAYGLYRDFGATFDFSGDETLALLVTAYEVDASGRFDSLDRTVVPITYYPAGSTACAE